MDDDVDYGFVWRIDRSKLIPTAKVSDVLAQLAAGGPGWIHANFVDTNESLPLITIRVGQSLGNPNPSINTSVESDKIVRIIEYGNRIPVAAVKENGRVNELNEISR